MKPTRATDLLGQRFGRLLVVERAGSTHLHQALWRCACDCGGSHVVLGYKLRQGHTKSCGCFKPGNRTHGKSRTPTHNSWLAMKQRCGYEPGEGYATYGAKGITVCDRWRDRFENFLADMGERPTGCTLDRIDNAKGYEPGNCRWATHREQRLNQERMR